MSGVMRSWQDGKEGDEAYMLLDVLSPERHIASVHRPLATLDGRGAGDVVQMGARKRENEFGDQLPSPATTGQSYNLVRGAGGKASQALLECLQDER